MALQHAVLALLADGPSHGYELRASFEKAVGPQWGGLNIGHTYQILERLSRDGLVASQRQTQQIKPDRLVYELTEPGRAELVRWLKEPAERARGHRDDLFLKLLAAGHLSHPTATADVIRRQRVYLLRQLHALTRAQRADPADPLNDLVAASAELHLRADLALLDIAEQRPLDASIPVPADGRVAADRHAAASAAASSTPTTGEVVPPTRHRASYSNTRRG